MKDVLHYRFERKFTTDVHRFYEVEQQVKNHPACFHEIFHQRRINNIYFDTDQFNLLSDNITGNPHRQKYRIRWYGEDFSQAVNPVLEIKIKKGFLGYKRSFPLPDFLLNDPLDVNIKQVFKQAQLSKDVAEVVATIKPKLFNTYLRKYYRSFDQRFRITIDKDIHYYQKSPGKISTQHPTDQLIVVELKYDEDDDQFAGDISYHLPYRYTKHSKYENGVTKVYSFLSV